MVLVKIDSNAILIEPMTSRKDANMIWAYNVLVHHLLAANIHPKKHVLDNKISNKTKHHIKEKKKKKNGATRLSPPQCSQGGHLKIQGALPKCARGNGRLVSAPPLEQTSALDQNRTQLVTPPIQCHTQCVGVHTPVKAI